MNNNNNNNNNNNSSSSSSSSESERLITTLRLRELEEKANGSSQRGSDRLVDLLFELNQGHVFDDWTERVDSEEDEKKMAFFRQLRSMNEDYPGGLRCYVENSRRLLRESLQGANPLEGWSPTVPEGVLLDWEKSNTDYTRYEEVFKVNCVCG